MTNEIRRNIEDLDEKTNSNWHYKGNGIYWDEDTGSTGTFTELMGFDKEPKAKPFVPSAAASTARATVANYGLKALTGSPKQKEWAEKIRADIIKRLPYNVRGHFAHLTTAKFWIENRQAGNEFWLGHAKVPAAPVEKPKAAPKKKAVGVAKRTIAIVKSDPALAREAHRTPYFAKPGNEHRVAPFEHLDGQQLEAFVVEYMTKFLFLQGAARNEAAADMRARYGIADGTLL
ncbi:hypothetical protein [Cereibacter johrii]|uniref:hypothetical protein n=1 Tax=Cereibacter johrii TaxID=445629 RepID=UPI0011BE5675|nr:hypothetical protein [Cereibacter johrii]